jgi:SAM-dependent methyltransferase
MERFYPLQAYVCAGCFLVQVEEFESPKQIFQAYSYFSSFSDSWVLHAKAFAEEIVQRLGLDPSHRVVEIGSNDGYLLQHFVTKGIPVLGIEPAANVAEAAAAKGIPTLVEFFGRALASRLATEDTAADLIVANNVLAHVPDLNDFVEGMKILLRPGGVISLEFPHLMRLIDGNQFDTIYHEHFSYFSFHTVNMVMDAHDLTIYDVEELPTHGGSLRIYVRHRDKFGGPVSERVRSLAAEEVKAGVHELKTYLCFGEKIRATKRKLMSFLIAAKNSRKSIAGYGAPAKGNTLLNYCGIGTDFLDYTVDRSPHKQGHYLPGTHIPILSPDEVFNTRPDYLLILPWNLADEITDQMGAIREWGGRFVIPIPEVRVL